MEYLHMYFYTTTVYLDVTIRYKRNMAFNAFDAWFWTGFMHLDTEGHVIGPTVWRWLCRSQEPILNELAVGFHARLGAKKIVPDDVLRIIVKDLHCALRADLSLP
jgi:hypothetical protein